MINRIRDLFRREARSRRCSECVVTAWPPPQPEGHAMVNEQYRQLDRCIDQLPMEQREVVMMRMHQDLKFEEIARIQGTCSSTARGRYRYGLGKLTELMHAG